MTSKSLLNWKMQLEHGSAILILFALGVISYRAMVVSNERAQWVRHTHEVFENLQDLLLAMASIESSYRGFVLTGRESYLQSYRASISRPGRSTLRRFLR
jgi:CHASE3 domain sensor protein